MVRVAVNREISRCLLVFSFQCLDLSLVLLMACNKHQMFRFLSCFGRLFEGCLMSFFGLDRPFFGLLERFLIKASNRSR